MTADAGGDQLAELRALRAEIMSALRALAPLPDSLKIHADRVDRALELLDGRLDQVERAQIKLEATLGALKLEDMERRIKSLEDDRTRVKAWAALIALLASVGAFIVGRIWK
jgi:Mg2+ and Co2+ transporter CorA